MSTISETSDDQLLDLLRQRGAMSVAEVAAATSVTATAVRQRLSRLMGQGLIERSAARAGRGRPSHHYSLTEKARRQAGSNFTDLALALWSEIRAIKDPEVRRGLLQRIASSMANLYGSKVQGDDVTQRMKSLQELFDERGVPVQVTKQGELPVLNILDCPYPDLVQVDRGICAMERMLFSELLATPLRLSHCRMEGHTCCQFETN